MAGATAQGLGIVNQLNQQSLDQLRGNQTYSSRQQAVQQAIPMFQQGDYAGAYGVMAKADPNWAYSNADKIDKIVPGFAEQMSNATKGGEQQAMNAAGNGANQVANTTGGWLAQAYANKNAANRPSTKIDPLDGLMHTYQEGSDLGPTTGPDGAAVTAGANGLNPKQTTGLKPFISDFQKQAKTMDDEINGSQTFQNLVNGNLPGSQLPAVMKFLTSQEGVKRFNSDEFHELGKPGDLADQTKQLVQQKIDGNPWTSDQTQYMTGIAKAMEASTYNAYLDKVESTSKGAAATLGADPNKIASIISANAHPAVKQIYDQMQKTVQADKDPVQAAQAINWARHNMSDPKSKAILQHFGFNLK